MKDVRDVRDVRMGAALVIESRTRGTEHDGSDTYRNNCIEEEQQQQQFDNPKTQTPLVVTCVSRSTATHHHFS